MAEAVECHSGHAYAERPTALTWQGKRLEIARLLDERRTPQGKTFRVETDDRQVFDLLYDEAADEWHIYQS